MLGTAMVHSLPPQRCQKNLGVLHVSRCNLLKRTLRVLVRAENEKYQPQELGLAPVKPNTPYGEMLQYYLKMEPQLFKTAVEDQLRKLKDEKEAKEAASKDTLTVDSMEIALYKRMEEVRAKETRATIEDLMYVSILEKFVVLGVEMLSKMDGIVDARPTNLKILTEGIHSKEALELVREHLIGIMGPASMTQFSNTLIKMSKLQMAQVYAASIMFGYFLRRVDKRFQLEKALGTLPPNREEAVTRLERLFSQVDEEGEASSQEGSSSSQVYDVGSQDSPSSSSSSTGSSEVPAKREKSALRRYVENFDMAMMVETARIVSAEGASLVERQTSGLLGDVKKLTAQIQEVVGNDAISMEEVMSRLAGAVERDAVETVTMTVATQRRAVLEAVAFGTFLRDVEGWVLDEYGLLTPLPPPQLPPGSLGDGNVGGGGFGPMRA